MKQAVRLVMLMIIVANCSCSDPEGSVEDRGTEGDTASADLLQDGVDQDSASDPEDTEVEEDLVDGSEERGARRSSETSTMAAIR